MRSMYGTVLVDGDKKVKTTITEYRGQICAAHIYNQLLYKRCFTKMRAATSEIPFT